MKKILGLIILSLFFLPVIVHADGAIMPPPNYWVYETGQKAAIVYENNIETLILQTSFQGNAKDFAYIVPTPAKPEVSKISDDIFANLEQLTTTKNEIIYSKQGLGVASPQTATEAKSVVVLEEKKVGIYDVKVLSANDANALYIWLKDNNFTYPESKKYILDDYIQNKWFITAAKINTDAITADVETKLKNGKLTPLKLVFQSQNIVYPLKISAITDAGTGNLPIMPLTTMYPSVGQSVPITLYVFADHKKDIFGFSTSYAAWTKKNEIEKLAKDDNGNAWIKPDKNKMYLTKLTRSMTTSEMTHDLFLDNASNNSQVGVPTWWENTISWIENNSGLVMFILILLFFLPLFWQFKKTNRFVRTISWITQIVSTLFFVIPVLAILFTSFAYTRTWAMNFYSHDMGVFMFLFAAPLAMLAIMVIEARHQKGKL